MISSSDPTFTVVLTTRDRPETLHEAVASVLAQRRDDWELVVVDDGSLAPAAVPIDSRIRLLRIEESRGPATARNAGVDAARGRWLLFLDDDDVFTPNRLELAARGLEAAPVAVCWSRYLDRPVGSNPTLEGDVSDTILDGLTPSMGATAVRREDFVAFDEALRGVEDVEWWLRTAGRAPVATVPEIGYLVRRRQTHDARQLRQRAHENLALLEAHADYFRTHPRAAAFRLKRAGLLALAVGDRADARRAFARSIRVWPSVSTMWHLARSFLPGDLRR